LSIIKREQLKKGIPILIVVIILFIFMDRVNNTEATFEVNEDEFSVVDSLEELNEKFYERIDGLAVAEQYDKVKSFDIEIPVLGEKRTLKVEKAWYFYHRIFVLYSLNVLPHDDKPEMIPSLTFSNITYHTPEEELQLPVQIQNDHHFNRRGAAEFVHNNRIYRGLTIHPDFKRNNEELFQKLFEQEKINGISINQAQIVDVSETKGIEINDIDLALDYEAGDEILENIEVNQAMTLPNGQEIVWKDFEMGIMNSRLFFSIKPNGKRFRQIEASYSVLGEESPQIPEHYTGSQIGFNGEEHPHIYISGFNSLPDQLNVSVQSIEYTSNDSLTFEVSGSDLNKVLKQAEFVNIIEEEAKQIHSYSFQLDQLLYRGSEIGVKFVIKSSAQPMYANMHFIPYKEFNERLANAPEQARNYMEAMGEPLIKIVDQNDDEVDYSQQGLVLEHQGDEIYFTQFFDAASIKNAESLKIELSRIPEVIRFEEKQSITIDLN
jgi:hypothetical protein